MDSERVTVGKMIGKGGEGQVFALNGRSGTAVKIYDSRLRVERQEKVRAMVRAGFAAETDLVAYPREVVSDGSGNFLGFVMRLVSGYRPIHELYSPKSRQRYFPEADYRFIIRAALNVARAVGKVHQTKCVIGDLNHSGLLVSRDARVALIDADSFQFRLGPKTYPCVVGVADFLPPELHGVHLATVVRSAGHDHFGLAVAIFHLLFMGRHPYAGRGPDITMGQAIAQNRFAFSLTRRTSTRTDPPPGALSLDVFPSTVRDAFESAFGVKPSARPSVSNWIGALTTLERSLNRCSKIKTHFYPGSAKVCVWCDLAGTSGGFDMFPDLSAVAPDIAPDKSATEQAIREILAFQFPVVSNLIPKSIVPAQKGSSDLRSAKRSKSGRALVGLLMLAGAGAGLLYAAPAWFIWFGLAGWGALLVGDAKLDAEAFREAFAKAEEALQRELDAFVGRNGLTEVATVRRDLNATISSYRRIDGDLEQELMELKFTREARQRAAFLDLWSIRSANISGIGPARKATLASFGIETAADVTRSAVARVPGFGDVMTRTLLDWRRGHESRFRYDPARNAQDIADEGRLRTRFDSRKSGLEATIRNGLRTLRTARTKIDTLPVRALSDQALVRILEQRLLAEQDLKVLGVPVPGGTIQSRPVFQTELRPQDPELGHGQRPAGSRSVPDCPRCGSMMRRRSRGHGGFWGCTRYPRCSGRRNI